MISARKWLGGLRRRKIAQRASAANMLDWLADRLRDLGMASGSGKNVSAETAIAVSAVFACVRVIAEDSAMAPLVVRRRQKKGGKWENVEDHWLTRLMRRPNDWQTGFEFRAFLTAQAAISGNGYAFINRRANGSILELLPFPSRMVSVTRNADWSITYQLTWPDGKITNVPQKDMFHLAGPSLDGYLGADIVKLAREAIGISIAAEESHARLHKNGVKLSGVLSQPPGASLLSDEQRKRIAQQWKEEFGPESDNQYGVAVLEGGFKFEPMAMTGAEAQHLETRRFQIEEVCRFFRVAPLKIGHADKAATNASSEQIALAHVSDAIAPWIERWSQRLDVQLLPDDSEPNTWVYFDLRGLMRGDATTRAAYYNSGIHAGWLNRQDARRFEGLEDGPDELAEFLTPTQLAPGDSADATNAKNKSSAEEPS